MLSLIYATLIGFSIGSFLNVLIYRLPLIFLGKRPDMSLSKPASSCPGCGHAVRWRDNVPVLSWLLLKGRCRDCGTGISLRYPTVELASGLLAYHAFLYAGLSVVSVALFLAGNVVLVLTLMRFDSACAVRA